MTKKVQGNTDFFSSAIEEVLSRSSNNEMDSPFPVMNPDVYGNQLIQRNPNCSSSLSSNLTSTRSLIFYSPHRGCVAGSRAGLVCLSIGGQTQLQRSLFWGLNRVFKYSDSGSRRYFSQDQRTSSVALLRLNGEQHSNSADQVEAST